MLDDEGNIGKQQDGDRVLQCNDGYASLSCFVLDLAMPYGGLDQGGRRGHLFSPGQKACTSMDLYGYYVYCFQAFHREI